MQPPAMNPWQVTYVTHACLRIDGRFGALVCDPWILNEPIYTYTTWKFPAATMPPQEVYRDVDYVFFSHPHEDHFHIPSIDLLPRDVQILLPEYTAQPGLRAQTMERTLREMGFHRIRKLLAWECFDLGGDARLRLVPAGRTKWWDWENAGFVLDADGRTLLNMNDCPADAELYAQLREYHPRVDIAFIQYAGVSMFPGCYRMSLDEMRAAVAQRRASWIQQRLLLNELDCSAIAPFAGDFAWLDPRMDHCNWSNRATPELFADFVRREFPQFAERLMIMAPGDRWTPQGGYEQVHPTIDWDRYLDAIEEVKTHYAPKVAALRQWLDGADTRELRPRTQAHWRMLLDWLPHHTVNFNVRVRFVIESGDERFDFVVDAQPGSGITLRWDDAGAVDQTLYVRAPLWAAVLEGRVLMNNLQWAAENRQHVEFRLEIAHFWFWFETHIDLNNRNPQALIDRALLPQLQPRIRPRHGVFAQPDEWDLPWLQNSLPQVRSA